MNNFLTSFSNFIDYPFSAKFFSRPIRVQFESQIEKLEPEDNES